jgi:hypothetical protein
VVFGVWENMRLRIVMIMIMGIGMGMAFCVGGAMSLL